MLENYESYHGKSSHFGSGSRVAGARSRTPPQKTVSEEDCSTARPPLTSGYGGSGNRFDCNILRPAEIGELADKRRRVG